jgi:hypothetical protein
MKFIGQYIQSLIARFRNDVYLEDISTGTIASGGNLGLDSNNKIVKATVSSGSGDITGVTLAGDSGSASDTSANVDLTIAGGNAITTSGSSTTITINHDDTSSQASVDNSGSTYIQDVTLDTYGHVTGLTSAAIPTLNQNTTGTAATVTEAEQTNITLLGTLTVLQVDDINLNAKTLKITGDTDDTFAVTAGANGATTFATTDTAGTAGHLTFDPDGDIILDTAGATVNNGIILKTNGTQFGDFNVHHSNSYLTLYEAGGTSLADYLQISVAAAGATTITTVDAGGATAHLDFAIDGHFSVASTGIDIATDGTITNATWQGNAIASAYLDADTAHYSATRQFTHHMFSDDIDQVKIYIGLQESDAENSGATNKNLPFLAPGAGKLIKILMRTNADLSANTYTFTLETVNTSTNTSTSPSVIGTQSGAGPTGQTMTTYDFTSSLDSGTNAIGVGDTV